MNSTMHRTIVEQATSTDRSDNDLRPVIVSVDVMGLAVMKMFLSSVYSPQVQHQILDDDGAGVVGDDPQGKHPVMTQVLPGKAADPALILIPRQLTQSLPLMNCQLHRHHHT